MSGTKIVVFQLKEIIRKMAFVAIGIAVLIALMLIFLPKDKNGEASLGGLYSPGTYTSEIVLNNSPVLVEVTVSENEIVSIDLSEMDEAQTVFYPLFQPTMEQLSKEIVSSQSLSVQTSNYSAKTEEILIKAIRAALDKAEQGIVS